MKTKSKKAKTVKAWALLSTKGEFLKAMEFKKDIVEKLFFRGERVVRCEIRLIEREK